MKQFINTSLCNPCNSNLMEDEDMIDGEPVILNVYDVMTSNSFLDFLGLGIYHSGVEVYDSEYAYGGHNDNSTGIYSILPKSVYVHGLPFRYKHSILIGRTTKTPSEVQSIIVGLGEKYIGSSYHILNKNCNHFTDDLAKLLCDQKIPKYINRMASLVSSMPFLLKLIPNDKLPPELMEERVDQSQLKSPHPTNFSI